MNLRSYLVFTCTFSALVFHTIDCRSEYIQPIQSQYIAYNPSAHNTLENNSTIIKESTVRILGSTEGSGAIVDKNKDLYSVLTAWHVVSPNRTGEEITIQTFDNKKHTVSIDSVQRIGDVDLAIINFRSPSKYKIPPISDRKLSGSSSLFVSGYPLAENSLRNSVGRLIASADVGIDQGYQLLYSNHTKAGMSGGPIFDDEYNLIGIHGRGELSQDQSLNIAKKTNVNQGVPIFYYNQFKAGEPIESSVKEPLTWSDYYALFNSIRLRKDDNDELKVDTRQTKIRISSKMIQLRPKNILGYVIRGGNLYQLNSSGTRMNADTLKALQLAQEWTEIKAKAKKLLLSDDIDESLDLFQDAEEYVTEFGSEDYMFKAALLNIKAIRSKDKTLHYEAVKEAQKGILLATNAYSEGKSALTIKDSNDERYIAAIYRELGKAYFGLGSHEYSLDANLNAIKWNQKYGLVGSPDDKYVPSDPESIEVYLELAISAVELRRPVSEICGYAGMANNLGAKHLQVVILCKNKYPSIEAYIPQPVDMVDLPADKGDYMSRYSFHMSKNEYRRALTLLNEAVEFNPFYSKYYFARGYVNQLLGNFAACIRDHTSAISIMPGFHTAYFERATCKEDMGDFDGAIGDYAFAYSIKRSRDILFNVGRMYDLKLANLIDRGPNTSSSNNVSTERFFARRSLNAWIKALAYDPYDGHNLWAAGRSAMFLGDYNQGCTFLQQAQARGNSYAADAYPEYRNEGICQ